MSASHIIKEIYAAIAAHGIWKVELRQAIRQHASDISPDDIRVDHLCAFGKWLNGPSVSDELRDLAVFQCVKDAHAEFHKSAGHVLDLALSGRQNEALRIMDGAYKERSDELIAMLHNWEHEFNDVTSDSYRVAMKQESPRPDQMPDLLRSEQQIIRTRP